MSIQNTPERVSLRSVTQATDPTWSGCRAKTAATKALRHTLPVKLASAR